MKLFSKIIRDRGKKGFTLVEMLIVIVVLVIIMAVAVPNVAGYVKRIKLMELDDSARSIYMAVQNKMTVMKQAGVKLEELKEIDGCFSYENKKYPYVFETPTPTTDPENPTPTPAPAPDSTDYLESEPRFLINKIEDGHGTNNPFVSLATIEGQLYNHYYVIEFDATTGRVFGVFYSEEDVLTKDFYLNTYIEKGPDGNDPRDFENRLHADELVGYYGGEGKLMQQIPAGGEVEKPTNVTDSTLEKLVFMLDPPFKDGSTTEYDTGRYYFKVEISGADARGKLHTVTIVPYEEGSSNNYYVENGKRGTVILDSIAPGCGADKGQWNLPSTGDMSGYTLERDFRGWVYIKDHNFVDGNGNPIAGAPSQYNPYEHSVTAWNAGKDYNVPKGINPEQSDQYFYIDPGANITVKITRYKEDSGTLESETAIHEVNSFFDSLDGDCAVIKAGRHLQNLANQPSVNKIKSARLEKDIDFSEDTGNYDSWNSAVTYKGTSEYPYLYNFKPVNLNYDGAFRANFGFSGKGKDGTQHVIKYIRIDTANDPRFKDNEAFKHNTAFFTNFDNTNANDVVFYCPVVIGAGECTAVFFGKCERGTNVSNFTLINPIVESSGEYVGGLFGEISGGGELSNHKVYVEEVTDYFNNYAFRYDERGERTSITWDDPENDPYARFGVIGTGEETYAGGLVGHTSGTQIKYSAAAIRVESKGYAGGLIGLADYDIIKCHVGGHTYNGSFKLSNGKYLVNIIGGKAAGGLAAVSNGGIDGCYTTCSVGCNNTNKEKCDTFVGSGGSGSGSNGAYAIGWLINTETNEYSETGTTWTGLYTNLNDLITEKGKDKNNPAKKTYDTFLPDSYPYIIDGSEFKMENEKCHLGDWPIEQTNIDGYGIFYWEKEGSAYKIKAVSEFDIDGNNEVSTLCTERDAQSITDYGYGYFHSSEYADGSTGGTDFSGDDLTGIQNALDAAGLRGVTFKKLSSTDHADKIFTFTANSGTVSATYHYNPDFCALSKDGAIDHYEIRSFVQLKNLSENNSYWSKNFSLSHDIPFSGTDAIKPIGVSETPFTGKFDGHLYRIINAKLTASGSDAGIFGYIEDATINGVVVFNADYSLQNLADNAAVGGVIGRATGTSSITNCAFTGIMDVKSSGSIAAGGIVGIAAGETEISNCQAVISGGLLDDPDMYVVGTDVSAGGIVGNFTGAALENCYSGGFISADTAICANPDIGGIAGTNANRENVTINNCYTYYQSNVLGAHPICNKGVGSLYYTNCYYLGGDWFNQNVGAIDGVKQWEDINVSESDKNNLYSKGLSSTSTAYSDDPITTFEYRLPATISEEGVFYHYGKSPDGTLVLTGDKRFGMFYWERESDGTYHIKAVGGFDVDGENTVSNLCTGLDGNSITQYGYGYFIGKGIKDGSYDLSGLNGLTASSDSNAETGIKSALENLIKNGGESLDTANLREFAFYDFSSSADTSVKSLTINSVEFKFVPGFCAISTGSGPAYKIRTLNHLKNVSAHLSSTFEQTHDIICGYEMMVPIGNAVNPFTGTYDGGCYRIHGLDLKSDENCVGLFGSTNKANIINTFVIEGKIDYNGSNSPTMGGIVGRANDTEIQNCIYTGSIEVHLGSVNSAVIGGIAGSCEGRTLINCEAAADINATGISSGSSATIGGIVGSIRDASVSSCYSGGSVSQNVELCEITAGGIVGSGNGIATVSNCYTHMNIPKFESIENVTVHPIGNNVNPTNCHYIESKNHYAHDFEDSTQQITKHTSFESLVNDFTGFTRPTPANTYRSGLTSGTDQYPMPAMVVNSKNEPVHYGNWKDIVPLNAQAYGVFYWEIEGEDEYHVRVRYIEEASGGDFVTKDAESKNFCTEMDGKAIRLFGYGYFSCGEKEIYEISDISNPKKGYITSKKDEASEDKIKKALNDCGISGFTTFEWNCGAVRTHKDSVEQLKIKTVNWLGSPDSQELEVNDNQTVYVKFNWDFCYLGIWIGDKDDDPNKGEAYEIRNNEQLGNIGYNDTYLGKTNTFIQTHDIFYPGGEGYSFEPIGSRKTPFQGKYYGNGYRIVGVKIEKDNTNYIGLFSCTENAEISGIIMYNAIIDVDNIDINVWVSLFGGDERIGRLGGIVGSANNTKIDNCAFYGTINGGIDSVSLPRYCYAVGGIVGYGEGSMSISNCESVISIMWKDSPLSASYHLSIGGIAGLTSGNIEHCYSGGNMKADKGGLNDELGKVQVSAGGIAGSGSSLAVKNCYSYMNIADDIEYADSICLKTFTHKPWALPEVIYNATVTNCYCLTAPSFYNHAVTDGITACETIDSLITTLKRDSAFSVTDNGGYNRYDVKAYATDIMNPGIYPLAAVVKDHSGQYAHYGNVNGLIQYDVSAIKSGEQHGDVSVTPKRAVPGETVKLKIDLRRGYVIDNVSVTYGTGKAVTLDQAFNPAVREYTFKMPEGNVTATVNIKSLWHGIEYTCNPDQGYISYEKVQAVENDSEPITFTVCPDKDKGWKCKTVTVIKKSDNTSVDSVVFDPETGVGSFTMPNDDVVVTAEFEEANQETVLEVNGYKITILATPSEGGTFNCYQNGNMELNITVNSGWRIKNVSFINASGVVHNNWGSGNLRYFNVPSSDVNITIEFEKDYGNALNIPPLTELPNGITSLGAYWTIKPNNGNYPQEYIKIKYHDESQFVPQDYNHDGNMTGIGFVIGDNVSNEMLSKIKVYYLRGGKSVEVSYSKVEYNTNNCVGINDIGAGKSTYKIAWDKFSDLYNANYNGTEILITYNDNGTEKLLWTMPFIK